MFRSAFLIWYLLSPASPSPSAVSPPSLSAGQTEPHADPMLPRVPKMPRFSFLFSWNIHTSKAFGNLSSHLPALISPILTADSAGPTSC